MHQAGMFATSFQHLRHDRFLRMWLLAMCSIVIPACAASDAARSRPRSRSVEAGVRALDRLTKPRTVEHKTLKRINFFDPVDHALLHALQNPRVNIAGIPIASHASFAGPATSAYSSGSLEPIATTSPASAAPLPQRSAVLLRP
jgi:hypothetical protein